MNNGLDGSLKFGTELDNEGFDRGSAKLLSAVNDLTKQVTHLGATMQQSFSGLTSLLRDLAVASRQSATGMNDSAHRTAMAGAEATVALENATTSTDQMSTSQTQQMAATDSAAQSMEQMSHVTDSVTQATQEATSAQAQVAEATGSAANAADRLSGAQAETERSTDRAATAASKYDKEIERLKNQIVAAEAALSDYYTKFNDYTEMIDRAEASNDAYAQDIIDTANLAIDALNERYAAELADLDALERKLAKVNAERAAALNTPNDDEDDGNIRDVGREAEEAAPRVGLLGNALIGLGQVMDFAANTALKLAKRLAQMAFRAITSSIKKATASLKSFSRQTNKTTLTSNGLVKSLTSLRRLLITRIKRMFISSIFKDVQEGIQQLAKFDKAFDQTMSRLKNSAKQLGGNVAVLIGNLIKTIEPIITKIISLLNTAVTAVNQFFAAISGKKTYTAAKMGTEDYAASVDKATKAQKKLNAELYGYDELTRQQAKDDSDSSSGDTASGIQYETRNIDLPTEALDWAEKLKQTWKTGDWKGVGQTLADGINSAMRALDDWINNKFRPWAVKWASRLGQIINGAVERLDWPLLGKTIADGINAVFAAANTFLKTVDWLALGKGIGAAIKSWFDNIDWALIAETFALKWNALFNVIKGIVTTPGIWESIGTAIGTFIKNWFATIDLDAIVDVIVGILNGIPKAINAFLAQNPFAGVPEKISSAINRVIHEVDWPGLVKSLGTLFIKLLNTLHDTVKLIDWYGLGVQIGNALASVNWLEVLRIFADTLWIAFKGLITGLFSTDGGKVFLALLAGVLALKGVFTLAKGAIFVAVGRFMATAILAPVTSALTAALPAAISGAAPAITGAVTGLGATVSPVVVAVVGAVGAAAVYETGKVAVDWIQAVGELDDAIHNELDTALSCYKRLFVEKGPEIANQWAQTCYQINTEGLSMEEAGIALAHRIEELSGQTMTNIDQRVTDGLSKVNVDTSSMLQIYSDLVDQHGLAVANSWFEMVSGIKLFNDNLCTNQDETNQIIVANMEAVSDWAKQNVNGTMTEVNAFVTEGLQTAEASVQSTNEAVMQGLFELNAGTKDALNIYLELVEQHGIDVANEWFEMVSGIKLFNDDLCTNQDETNQIIVANLDAISEYSQMKTEDTMSTLENRFDTGMEGINTTTDKGMDTLHGTADRGMTRVKSTLTSKMTQAGDEIKRQNWGSIGDSIVKGIGQGIQNGWTWLQNTVVNIARNLLNAAKAALGINSPSKVFSDIIGAGVTEGWALGMNQTKGDVLETVANISDAMVNEAADGATIHTQLDASMDGTISGMQAVIAGLSNVALTFKTIADTLAGIGALTTPQISAGAVVPYKTRVAATSPSEGDSGGLTGHLSGIETALQNLIALMQTQGGGQSDIRIIIDGREVFNAVVNENNRAIRRTGASPLRT